MCPVSHPEQSDLDDKLWRLRLSVLGHSPQEACPSPFSPPLLTFSSTTTGYNVIPFISPPLLLGGQGWITHPGNTTLDLEKKGVLHGEK